VTVVINEQDQVVYQKRLPNDLSLIAQLSSYRASLEGIVVESTYNWYWLVDGLMEKGHRVHLANTAAIQQYNGLKYTDDHSDARWLAHLLRLGVLPEGYIYPGFRSRENHVEEFGDGTELRSGMGVMIVSGRLGVWSVKVHSNCAAIGSPSDTVRKRRKNSGRSGSGIAKRICTRRP
jgi:hypothetical protein